MASSGYVEGFVLDVALPGFSETLDVLFIVVSDENTNSHKHVEKKADVCLGPFLKLLEILSKSQVKFY